MIARLRRKFILIAMGSLILVLVVLMGIVNTANFLRMDQSAGEVLELLAENGGGFPDIQKRPDGKENSDGDGVQNGQDLTKEEGFAGHRNLSQETPYETRYFSVNLSDTGSILSVNTGKIAAVSSDTAVTMAQALQTEGKISGYSGSYKYLATDTNQGVCYVFLDCTKQLHYARSFLSVSLLVCLCGVLAVFLLVLALSKRAIRPVVESYEKQKQFITNAGHEIKTPLAIIDSCAEVVEMEGGESKWTQGIRGQVERLTALTQSLVALARMDEGSANLIMTDFDLSQTAEETLTPFALLAENRGLKLALDIQPGIRYHGSEQTLRQLCSILADNAVKYALPNTEIQMSLGHKGKRVLLTSQNMAEGLTAGDQQMLFDRFYRGDTSHSSETKGYGIGLSMARSIVEAHGGKISAFSPDGTSLVMTVQL